MSDRELMAMLVISTSNLPKLEKESGIIKRCGETVNDMMVNIKEMIW